jgi:hypothetical protein
MWVFPQNIKKSCKDKTSMDVIEKLKEFLSSKDEKYVSSLKEHFFARMQVDKNEAGDFDFSSYDKSRMDVVFTKDYIIESFVEIPGGFAEFLYLIDEFLEPISEIILHFLSSYCVNQLEGSIINELKNELDSGSDKALHALANEVLKKMGKEDLSSSKREYQILKNILINLNGNIFKVLMQAVLAIHLGLDGTAKMQIQHALKLLINKLTPYKMQHSVVEVSTVKFKAQQAGKKGSTERWKLERKVKEEAFKKLREMKDNGKFQNNSQASKKLINSLYDFAKQIECPFADHYSAQRRIYDWFRTGQ